MQFLLYIHNINIGYIVDKNVSSETIACSIPDVLCSWNLIKKYKYWWFLLLVLREQLLSAFLLFTDKTTSDG